MASAGAAGSTAAGGRTNTGGAAGAGAGGAKSSVGCGASDPLKSGRASIDVSGTKREYILDVPDNYEASKPYKLIFGFHWRGGSANDVATGSIGGGPYYGLKQRAAGSTLFVAPEGIDAGFANTGGRDIALVRALLALFRSKLCIDEQRIFSTGFSYGGMMSDSIGCEMADVFRAIAPMAGAIPNADHPYSGCNKANDHPIAVWMSHGDADNVVPLADGKDALALFVARNQCRAETSAVTPSPCVAYQGCTAGYPIHFCQFSGGHSAPSFASAAIWSFFNQF
jgi:poly(3-hydroxybutyrate) depolymerase